MGVFVRGNPITLIQKFEAIDVITQAAVLGDPDSVTFTVQHDDVDVAYVFGTDAEVTNPEVGVYLCNLPPDLASGEYAYVAEGTSIDPDGINASGAGTFTVVDPGVLDGEAPTVAVYGPCTPWIFGTDVFNACAQDELDESQAYKFEQAASIGSSVMWDLSGRQFPGICHSTVRPCRTTGCSCFSLPASGPFAWSAGLERWVNECGDRCGCGTLSQVKLAGYPVRTILEVKIDGAVVPSSEYRLDDRRMLTAVGGRIWPGCQDLSLGDDDVGAFTVEYLFGVEPPELGKLAAAQLGCEVWKALNGQNCSLGSKATKVVRQGVTVERIASFAQMFRSGATGLTFVDLFLAQVNPSGSRRPPAVFNLDGPQFARKVGQ